MFLSDYIETNILSIFTIKSFYKLTEIEVILPFFELFIQGSVMIMRAAISNLKCIRSLNTEKKQSISKHNGT